MFDNNHTHSVLLGVAVSYYKKPQILMKICQNISHNWKSFVFCCNLARIGLKDNIFLIIKKRPNHFISRKLFEIRPKNADCNPGSKLWEKLGEAMKPVFLSFTHF